MDEYVEAAVRTVLTAADDELDATVAEAALLFASAGSAEASDRVIRQWLRTTGRPVTRLAADAPTARAWAMLCSQRPVPPSWARQLPPLDLDAEEHAHGRLLERAQGGKGPKATLAGLAARVRQRAEAGEVDDAQSALQDWADAARCTPRPDLATLAGNRRVAALLVRGALPLPEDWVRNYADALVAALHARHPNDAADLTWPELLTEILRLRSAPDTAPAPASGGALAEAQQRLGLTLPESYREFLAVCDGLPADVVFPRLLSASELRPTPEAEVVVSEPPILLLRTDTGEVLEHDPVFGVSVHRDLRTLLEQHRRLLEAAVGPLDYVENENGPAREEPPDRSL